MGRFSFFLFLLKLIDEGSKKITAKRDITTTKKSIINSIIIIITIIIKKTPMGLRHIYGSPNLGQKTRFNNNQQKKENLQNSRLC